MSAEFKKLLMVLGGIFLVLGGWMLAMGYGVSWDEPIRWNDGDRKLAYYKSLLSEAPLPAPGGDYPGFYDVSLAAFRDFTGMDLFPSARLWNTFFFLAAVGGTFLVGKEWGIRWVGLVAVGVLLAMPRFVGHGFINPKDLPFAAGYIWGLWGLMRLVAHGGRRWKDYWIFGILVGLAASLRVGGLVLLGYLVGVLICWLVRELAVQCGRVEGELGEKKIWIKRVVGGLMAGALAAAVLFVWWPSMHGGGMQAVVDTGARTVSFGWKGSVLFEGQVFQGTEVPRTYILKMLMVTTPVLWLAALLALAVVYLRHLPFIFGMGTPRFRENLQTGVLLFAVGFPVALVVVQRAQIYDGIRHLLFVLPPAAVLVGGALVQLGERLRKSLRVVGGVLLGAYLLSVMGMMLRLHPYQYTYYNEWAWIRGNPAEQYETEYWATSYREATLMLNSLLAGIEAPPGGWRIATIPRREVLLAGQELVLLPMPLQAELFFGDDLWWVWPEDEPDFAITTYRFGYAEMLEGKKLFSVERAGVEFARCVVLSERGMEAVGVALEARGSRQAAEVIPLEGAVEAVR